MSKYIPDRWVILEITRKGEKPDYKILASWYGGYTGSDSWKLSSGIMSVERDPKLKRVVYPQYSGSTYICHDNNHGMSSYTHSILSGWLKELEATEHTMVVVPSDFDVSDKL